MYPLNKLSSIVVSGQIIGPIWQGQVCTEEFSKPVTGTVREALIEACKCGDFQHADIDCAILTIKWEMDEKTTLTRRFGLSSDFKAIGDLFFDSKEQHVAA